MGKLDFIHIPIILNVDKSGDVLNNVLCYVL